MPAHNWRNDFVKQHVKLIFGTLTLTEFKLTETLIRKSESVRVCEWETCEWGNSDFRVPGFKNWGETVEEASTCG